MKKLLLVVALLFAGNLFSAGLPSPLYAKAAGGNWSAAGTWSATSSAGSDSVGPPTSAQAVVFDTGSLGTVTVDNSSAVCAALTFQSASNLLNMGTGILTPTGSITFFTRQTISGTGTLALNTSNVTITSNAVVFPGAFTFNTSGTKNITLSGNFTVAGSVTFGGTISYVNSGQLICQNGLTTGTSTSAGTGGITLQGGTWTTSGGNIETAFTINPVTAVTLPATISLVSGSLTYTAGAGSVSGASTTLTLAGAGTINTSGITWGNILISSGTAFTLGSALTTSGYVQLNSTTPVAFTGPYSISCATLIMPNNADLTISSGQTLTISNQIQMTGCPVLNYNATIYASSAAYINYTGTAANCLVSGSKFINITNTGNLIYNWYGVTSSVTGIQTVTESDIGAHNVFGGVH